MSLPIQIFPLAVILAILCQATGAAEVRITVAVQGQDKTPRLAEVMAEPVLTQASAGEEPRPVKVSFQVPGEAGIDLDTTAGWRLSVTAEGLWSPAHVLPPGEESTSFTLVPTVEVSGGLRPSDDGERPEELEASFRSVQAEGDERPPAETETVEGRLDCEVGEDAWKCRLPVGTWDLRLRSPGFISHFFWALEFEEGKPHDLGSLIFERGSAIFGRLTTEDDGPLNTSGRVTAKPPVAARAQPGLRERVAGQALAQQIDERGFFHLKDLAPGNYTVTATHDGYVPTKLTPVVVTEGTEVEVDDLVFIRPLELEVRVTPATDLSDKGWLLMLLDPLDTVPVGQGAADEEGRWRLSGLSPGDYMLLITTRDGRRMSNESIRLEPGSTSFDFELPIVWVEGTLRLGGAPLSGVVYFGGRHTLVSVDMASDAEGRFTGWLPRDGEWKADVTSDDPRVFRRIPKLEVVPEGGVAEVEILLPDTLLEGEVVDEQGKAIPDAVVLVVPAWTEKNWARASTERTDEDGRYAVRGNAMGTYYLEARGRQGSEALASERIQVEISEETPVATTRLVARRMHQFRGRLVAAGRGVVGAKVTLDGLVGEGPAPLISPQARTDVDGRFALDLTDGMRSGWITVFAPGYVLYRRPVTITLDTEVLVTLELSGGRLHVRTTEGARPPLNITGADGVDYDLSILMQWAALNGFSHTPTELIVPAMSAGAYTVCWPKEADRDEICRQGSLAPGQDWVLDLATAENPPTEGENP